MRTHSPMIRSNRFTLTDSRTPWHLLWDQPISMVIRMPWPLFLVTLIGVFLLQVGLFWLLFHLDESAHRRSGAGGPAEADGLLTADSARCELQLLHAETLPMCSPVSALESLAGMLTIAVVTALFLARLLQTEAPLIFEQEALPDLPHRSASVLSLRHPRSEQLAERPLQPELVHGRRDRAEHLAAKGRAAQADESQTPQLSLTATITHPLDAESPLRQLP